MAASYVLAVRELQKHKSIYVRKPLGVRRGSISSPIKSELSRLRNQYTRCINVIIQSHRCKRRKLVPALALVQMLIRVALQIPNDLVSSDSLGPSPPSCH